MNKKDKIIIKDEIKILIAFIVFIYTIFPLIMVSYPVKLFMLVSPIVGLTIYNLVLFNSRFILKIQLFKILTVILMINIIFIFFSISDQYYVILFILTVISLILLIKYLTKNKNLLVLIFIVINAIFIYILKQNIGFVLLNFSITTGVALLYFIDINKIQQNHSLIKKNIIGKFGILLTTTTIYFFIFILIIEFYNYINTILFVIN